MKPLPSKIRILMPTKCRFLIYFLLTNHNSKGVMTCQIIWNVLPESNAADVLETDGPGEQHSAADGDVDPNRDGDADGDAVGSNVSD
mmetsp:Transcript_9465/g.14233  ORF Transcript_9465/g.14233 Transcript_9465/m.14233 type:complete len:87 (-) Transcript_9465:1299-1559(-)